MVMKPTPALPAPEQIENWICPVIFQRGDALARADREGALEALGDFASIEWIEEDDLPACPHLRGKIDVAQVTFPDPGEARDDEGVFALHAAFKLMADQGPIAVYGDVEWEDDASAAWLRQRWFYYFHSLDDMLAILASEAGFAPRDREAAAELLSAYWTVIVRASPFRAFPDPEGHIVIYHDALEPRLDLLGERVVFGTPLDAAGAFLRSSQLWEPTGR
jgi:hypothetical protein